MDNPLFPGYRTYTRREAAMLPPLVLAYIGDAVFELHVRTKLVDKGVWRTNDLHKGSVGLVKASSQAAAVRRILDSLNEEELAVYKRGRNTKGGNVPKGSSTSEYRMATGFEALVGYLWITGSERLAVLLDDKPVDRDAVAGDTENQGRNPNADQQGTKA